MMTMACEHCKEVFAYIDARKNRPRQYCGIACANRAKVKPKGSAHKSWTGVGTRTKRGYIDITTPDGRRMKEHRYVMEQALGRPLFPDENVHHRNGRRDDNRLANLELWTTGQPAGQRVEDALLWAHELIKRYEVQT